MKKMVKAKPTKMVVKVKTTIPYEYFVVSRQIVLNLICFIVYQYVQKCFENDTLKKNPKHWCKLFRNLKPFQPEFQSRICNRIKSKFLDEIYFDITDQKGNKISKYYLQMIKVDNVVLYERDYRVFLGYLKENPFTLERNKKWYLTTEEIKEFTDFFDLFIRHIPKWEIDPGLIKFINTQYYLYYYDESFEYVEKMGLSAKKINDLGVSRALLILGNFGTAKIINYDLKTKTYETYIGRYDILDRKFLSLELHVEDSLTKNLSCKIYIGTDRQVNIAVGLFNDIDVDENIYAGTIVIKKITYNSVISRNRFLETIQTGDYTDLIRFFSSNEENRPGFNISKHIVKLLKNKNTNYISVRNTDIDDDRHLNRIRKSGVYFKAGDTSI